MKKFILFAAIIAFLLGLVQIPMVSQLLSSSSSTLWTTQEQIEAEQSKQAARNLLVQLADTEWGEVEIAYLSKITQSLDELSLFQRRYCMNEDKNPVIFGDKLKLVCDKLPSVLAPLESG